MIEFTESDYPPFLFGPFRIFSADNKEVFSAVQTTFEELSNMGIRLSERQESGSLPTAFLHQYGARKIFAIIDWETRTLEDAHDFFIEVTSQEDANALRAALMNLTLADVMVEEPRRWHTQYTLEGFRNFTIYNHD